MVQIKRIKGCIAVAILFFCFFDNFAILNFDRVSLNGNRGFGLQFAWACGIIMIILIFMQILKNNKIPGITPKQNSKFDLAFI